MGYYGPMGFSIEIPAHRVGGPENLWGIRGYGLSGVWNMRVSTVDLLFICLDTRVEPEH